jgi:hypothetical protein
MYNAAISWGHVDVAAWLEANAGSDKLEFGQEGRRQMRCGQVHTLDIWA